MTEDIADIEKPSIEPTPYVAKAPDPPSGSTVFRGFNAIFKERRLPYAISSKLDSVLPRFGLRKKTVVAGDLRFRVRRGTADEGFVQNIVTRRDYNPTPEYEIREADTVIDVGGQIGSFAVQAARNATRGSVYTFEPEPNNFALLEQNIKLNGLHNLRAENLAVAGNTVPLKLYLTGSFTGGNTILATHADPNGPFLMVDTVTLPLVFERFKIDRCNFLKMDCEGSEYDILYNTPREYLDRIDRIVMEYHCTTFESKRREADRLVKYLEDSGYFIDEYTDFTKFRCGFIRARRKDLVEDPQL